MIETSNRKINKQIAYSEIGKIFRNRWPEICECEEENNRSSEAEYATETTFSVGGSCEDMVRVLGYGKSSENGAAMILRLMASWTSQYNQVVRI
ncbi:hypothetical protein SAMN05216308_1271 [Nitrosospira sp. Nsp13]|nr:hypothetical protein SAMN05216308_1271 [Nitrosospira sp. Nsp13]